PTVVDAHFTVRNGVISSRPDIIDPAPIHTGPSNSGAYANDVASSPDGTSYTIAGTTIYNNQNTLWSWSSRGEYKLIPTPTQSGAACYACAYTDDGADVCITGLITVSSGGGGGCAPTAAARNKPRPFSGGGGGTGTSTLIYWNTATQSY